ncbi:sodium- and chloride-dependent glycine transporter-like protein [Dinothrombium tinctorium]|uniref:Sodium-and chloride-dependent glycine transporter-like protein n=1 Tax=Dinothrombium tinctorium TaxID=1965070 RepID=A0A3S3S0B9_9ACAR|nr:sodium- and chloride-dependent glycine transporter-like protein [Dinothrombium tinctorium]
MYEWSLPQPGLTISLLIVTLMVTLALCRGVKSTGIKFYVKPDVNKLLDLNVWMDALISLFYSLGVGMGCMIVYGSYNRFHNKLLRDVVFVIFGDVCTSIFSGFVVFSMVGYVAGILQKPVHEVVANGRALAFTVILSGLSTLPGAAFWSVCFFIGLLTLGIDSQFAFVETVTSLPFATRTGIYLFDMYEMYAAGVPVMLVAILECVLIGYVYGIPDFSSSSKCLL